MKRLVVMNVTAAPNLIDERGVIEVQLHIRRANGTLEQMVELDGAAVAVAVAGVEMVAL